MITEVQYKTLEKKQISTSHLNNWDDQLVTVNPDDQVRVIQTCITLG